MNLRSQVAKLTQILKPPKTLEIKIVYHVNEVTDIESAIWVVLTV